MTRDGVRVVVAIAMIGAVTWLTGTGTATATLPMQKKAKELGYAATNCQYCHVEKLPKKGAVTHNDRGKWLHEEKEKRKVKEVDVSWLKDYVEKKADEKK